MKLAQTLRAAPRLPGFGTSGIRATVDALDDLTVYCIVAGTLAYLRGAGRLSRAGTSPAVPIGGDLRASTTRILRAAARAVSDAGLAFEYAGRVPTPALALRALEAGSACIMVTGSHIPADRNGLKAYAADGELLKEDEAGVTAAIGEALEACLERDATGSPFGPDGMLRDGAAPALGAADPRAARGYLDRYARAFPAPALAGLRVLVFEHSAVGRDVLVEALEGAGAEVLRAGRSESFVPIDTEALTGEQLDAIAASAAGHRDLDAIVSTDGDGDRPLVLGVAADGSARFVRGDVLGALVAGVLGATRAAVPVTASPAIADWARARGVELTSTRVGSPYVIEALRAGGRDGETAVGWEANGGFLLGSPVDATARTLAPLPTRDAVLPILAVLHEAARRGRRVHELASEVGDWDAAAGLLDGVDASVGHAITGLLGEAPAGRPGPDDARAPGWEALDAALEPSPAAGALERASALDGLRLELASGDIVHVRPSGNAPQLRVYAFSRERGRAARIVAEAVGEPGGLLRRLERLARAGAGSR